jgi:two-component system nitrogen regulation response regulator NtrX
MTPATQAKVLRVLQEQSFCRVGGTVPINVDVRVIAASNKNLEAEIQKGTFREDLYYRLNVIPLTLPPLRERVTDIPILTAHLIREIADEQGMKPKQIMPEGLELLKRHLWPGNVRELRNLLERFMILVPHSVISEEDIRACWGGTAPEQPDPSGPSAEPLSEGDSLKTARTQFERAFILKKLAEHRGNINETAEALQIGRTHLYQKMKLLKIEPPWGQGKELS